MAATPVNQTTNTNTGNVAWSTSFNCTGADYLLYSCSMGRANSGVTYAGVAMTMIARVSQSAIVTEVLELWGLKAPATGANNLTVTPGGGAPQDTKGTISCWSGIDQTTPTGTAVTTNQDNQSNASISATVSSATGEVVIAAAMVYNKAVTPGASQTSLGVQQAFPGNAMSYKAGATSTTVSYSWSGNQISALIAVPLKAAGAGGSSVTVDPVAASLTLSGQSVTVKRGVTAAPSARSLSLAGQSVAVKRGVSVSPSAASFALSGQSVAVKIGRTVSPSSASLSLTGQSVTASVGRSVTPSAASLALSGQLVGVKVGRTVAPQAGSLTLTGGTVSVSIGSGVDVVPQAGSLSLNGRSVSVKVAKAVSPQAASLAFAGQAVTVQRGVVVAAQARVLSFTGFPVTFAVSPAVSRGTVSASMAARNAIDSTTSSLITTSDLSETTLTTGDS
jgi:hypothetical protein